MKRILSIIATLSITIAGAQAQTVDGWKVENLKMKRSGDYMAVKMDASLADLDVASNSAVIFTPIIVNGKDSLELSSVGFYGRKRYYQTVRSNDNAFNDKNSTNYRASERPEQMDYSVTVPYQNWMDGSHLMLSRREYGCCNKVVNEQMTQLVTFNDMVLAPKYVYIRPKTEKSKARSLSGTAFIDFVVSSTVINPDHRDNKNELQKIIATIDSVRNDKDITITSLSIKGFASPESSYENNTRLAKGRTESLKQYVQNLYHFDNGFISTSYEPEDWAGLRKFVEASDLEHKKEIIDIIDSDKNVDWKDYQIKSLYADEYMYLLAKCFPMLRRSEYNIEYTIRSFTDIEEIKRIFAESPQKLSLEEFYLLANEYGDNTKEINEIYETAVRMYPKDATANLNAAISEMQNNDLNSAKTHLDKAGNSPQAIYAKGLHAAFSKDYDKALELLTEAQKQGIAEAADAIRQVNEMK